MGQVPERILFYVTLTPGNATDFGDQLCQTTRGATSNGTRGFYGGGMVVVTLQTLWITSLASTGNARFWRSVVSEPARGNQGTTGMIRVIR